MAQYPPPYVPCNETNEDTGAKFEFHSLRPYQASPCDRTYHDIALFCGHNFILPDQVVIQKQFGDPPTNSRYVFEGAEIFPVSPSNEYGDQACYRCVGNFCQHNQAGSGCDWSLNQCIDQEDCSGSCRNNGDGTETCTFEVEKEKNTSIEWGAEFPILGNTDDVINYNNFQSIINATNNSQDLILTKVPDAYIEPLDVYDPTKVNEYVSWYLNGTIYRQEYPRIITGEAGTDDASRIINFSGPIRKLLSFDSQTRQRRDTMVWANRSERLNDTQADEIGLVDDKGNLIDPYSFAYRHDQIITCTSDEGCFPNGMNSYARVSRYARLVYPPLLIEFKNFDNYWNTLKSWYERTISEWWFNVPFSSTEDRKGKYYFNSVNPVFTGGGVTKSIRVIKFVVIQSPSELFFSHALEVEKLAQILQSTFAFQGAALSGKPTDIMGPNNPYCELLEVRSNPGDDLFPTKLKALFKYTLQMECTFHLPYPEPGTEVGNLCESVSNGTCQAIPAGYCCESNYGQVDCGTGQNCANNCLPESAFPGGICPDLDDFPSDNCIADINISLGTVVETPLVDAIWSRLVSGPAGIFRKFFPKIEESNPVFGIMDLPAEADFRLRVMTGDLKFKGSQAGTGKKIYFPHLGGIHQYFLKCIQTALRPDGYGGFCKREPGEIGSIEECFGVSESGIPPQYLALKDNFISLANRWDPACEGDDNNFAKECYNHVVASAMVAGVNPALALTIWLNESGASNYCSGGPTTKDFGVYDQSIAQNYPEQLKRFLVLPFVSYYSQCERIAQEQNLDPMAGFLNVFLTGKCEIVPGDQTCSNDKELVGSDGWEYYLCVRDCTWNWVTNGQCGDVGNCGQSAGRAFGIRGATDILCP